MHIVLMIDKLQRQDSPRTPNSTRLSEAEEQLHIVVDAMTAAVTRCSRDLTYLWVSKSYAAWLGLTVDEIAGHDIAEVIGSDGVAAIQPYIDRVLGGQRVEYEAHVPFRGVGPRWIHAVYVPTWDGGTQPTGWVAV